MTLNADNVRGCLLAGACGDALGAPVEFLNWDSIANRFGKGGIADYTARGGFGYGAITDDTQMTLFTLEGLLRAHNGDTNPVAEVRLSYLDWLATQGRPVPSLTGELVNDGRLHAQRAPGITCLTALESIAADAKATNDSKGCGGVMRVAPVGFWPAVGGWASDERIFTLAARLAWLTHKHPSGYLPAGVLAVMVRHLVHGALITDALEAALVALRNHADNQPEDATVETDMALRKAILLAETGKPTPQRIEKHLGGGWTGESALAIAVCASLRASSLAEGVRMAVNHSGDSDSTGAIAGNILGAAYGEQTIPAEWLEPLECRDLIEGMADKAVAVWS